MIKLSETVDPLAQNCANFLLDSQVTHDHEMLAFDNQKKLANVTIRPLNKCNTDINLTICYASDGSFSVRAKNKITVRSNQLFRLSLDGKLSTIENFFGTKPQERTADGSDKKEETATDIEPVYRTLIKKAMNQFPPVYKFLKNVRDTAFPAPLTDFSGLEGITYCITDVDGSFKLICHDYGGIYDEHLNAEGHEYPPQVAGEYYADAYSAILFLNQYKITGLEKWKEASLRAQRFMARNYPHYKPARIAWHHSDFKNAAIFELLLNYPEHSIMELKQLSHECIQDWYEPTNVFALRIHWKTLLKHINPDSIHLQELQSDILKVKNDQTDDGLFHDNIVSYTDAHDFTYHQYTCACLALSLLDTFDKQVWGMFIRGVEFTLNFVTPQGEPAYVGRASNNLHHAASAALSFAVAAKFEHNDETKALYLSAIEKIAKRVTTFRTKSNMYPTSLNKFVSERMGWNHCETPYNALAGFMFAKVSELVGSELVSEKTLIPLETKDVHIADDAGYARVSNGEFYLSVFSGCEKSYAWSEGIHITGAAGIAALGTLNTEVFYPCLDVHAPTNQLVSDLPSLNGKHPYLRGKLYETCIANSILLHKEYGDCVVKRLYVLYKGGVLFLTHISAATLLSHQVDLFAFPLLADSNIEAEITSASIGPACKIKIGDSNNFELYCRAENSSVMPILSDIFSNPKGYARKVSFPANLHSKDSYSYAVLTNAATKPKINIVNSNFVIELPCGQSFNINLNKII